DLHLDATRGDSGHCPRCAYPMRVGGELGALDLAQTLDDDPVVSQLGSVGKLLARRDEVVELRDGVLVEDGVEASGRCGDGPVDKPDLRDGEWVASAGGSISVH